MTDRRARPPLSLRDWSRALKRFRYTILACVIGVPLIAVVVNPVWFKNYKATATVFLPSYTTLAYNPKNSSLVFVPAGGITGHESDFIQGVVADAVQHKLGYFRKVGVQTSLSSDTLTLTVFDPRPAVAIQAVNTYADEFAALGTPTSSGNDPNAQLLAQLRQERKVTSPDNYTWIDAEIAGLVLNDQIVDAANQYNTAIHPVVLTRAETAKPVFIGAWYAFFSGLVAGTLLGLVLAVAFDRLDPTLRTREELEEATALGVLGVTPRQVDDGGRPEVLERPDGEVAHAHRSIGLALEVVALHRPMCLMQFTCADDLDGTTTIVANQAVSEARMGRRVVAVDLNLRAPSLAERFDISPGAPGFTSLVLGDVDVEEALIQPDPALPLWVLPPGPLPPSPSDFLAVNGVARTLHALADVADLVIIDTPNLLNTPDALTVSGIADAVVIVGRLHHTRRVHLRKSVERLDEVNAPLIGSILAGVGGDELLALVTDSSMSEPVAARVSSVPVHERDAVLVGSASEGAVQKWSTAQWSGSAWDTPGAPPSDDQA